VVNRLIQDSERNWSSPYSNLYVDFSLKFCWIIDDDLRVIWSLLQSELLLSTFQFLSGGQSEVQATLNLNAMNQSPNPWHVSFSYARALQNTVLKTWQGRPDNVEAAQKSLLVRAKANSLAQLGRYSAEGESEEATKGMFVKGYTYWAALIKLVLLAPK